MTEATKPIMNTRTREAESSDQVRVALMTTRSATPRYVVPSMTAEAKRSGGEAGVTSRETASPVRT